MDTSIHVAIKIDISSYIILQYKNNYPTQYFSVIPHDLDLIQTRSFWKVRKF